MATPPIIHAVVIRSCNQARCLDGGLVDRHAARARVLAARRVGQRRAPRGGARFSHAGYQHVGSGQPFHWIVLGRGCANVPSVSLSTRERAPCAHTLSAQYAACASRSAAFPLDRAWRLSTPTLSSEPVFLRIDPRQVAQAADSRRL
eukprot:4174456-Prymnesium_polylepis.1